MSLFFIENEGTYMPTMAGYGLLVAILVAILLIGAAISGRGKKFTAKQIAFSGVAIALGTVASLIKILNLPQGGSVTLFSMLFVTMVGYWYGARMGITAAVSYGILQLILGPYIINPIQPIVDYVLAFGALGLSGFFSNSKHGLIKGYIVGVAGRFIFAFLSGIIFFGQYAPNQDPLGIAIYSASYNGLYLAVEAGFTLVLLAIEPVRSAIASVKRMATEQQ